MNKWINRAPWRFYVSFAVVLKLQLLVSNVNATLYTIVTIQQSLVVLVYYYFSSIIYLELYFLQDQGYDSVIFTGPWLRLCKNYRTMVTTL